MPWIAMIGHGTRPSDWYQDDPRCASSKGSTCSMGHMLSFFLNYLHSKVPDRLTSVSETCCEFFLEFFEPKMVLH